MHICLTLWGMTTWCRDYSNECFTVVSNTKKIFAYNFLTVWGWVLHGVEMIKIFSTVNCVL